MYPPPPFLNVPLSLAKSGSAPSSSRKRIKGVCPLPAATISGVHPALNIEEVACDDQMPAKFGPLSSIAIKCNQSLGRINDPPDNHPSSPAKHIQQLAWLVASPIFF